MSVVVRQGALVALNCNGDMVTAAGGLAAASDDDDHAHSTTLMPASSTVTIAPVMAGTKEARLRLPGSAVVRRCGSVWRDETGTEPARLRIEQASSWLGEIVWDDEHPPWGDKQAPPPVRRLLDPSDLNIIMEEDLRLVPPPLPPLPEDGDSSESVDSDDSEAVETRAEKKAKRLAEHRAAVEAAEAEAAEAEERDQRAVLRKVEWTKLLARAAVGGVDGVLGASEQALGGGRLTSLVTHQGHEVGVSDEARLAHLAAAACGGWGGFGLASRLGGGNCGTEATGSGGCWRLLAQVGAIVLGTVFPTGGDRPDCAPGTRKATPHAAAVRWQLAQFHISPRFTSGRALCGPIRDRPTQAPLSSSAARAGSLPPASSPTRFRRGCAPPTRACRYSFSAPPSCTTFGRDAQWRWARLWLV